MTIGELKEAIKDMPDDTNIVMSKDAEGNDYSPLYEPSLDIYIPECSWSGNVYDPEWSAYDAGMTEEDWEEVKKEPKSLVLWPMN